MKKLVAVFCLLVYSVSSFACSTFLLQKDGRYVFGRNYDWVTGNGMITVNARGVEKTSFVAEGEKTTTWVSKCGSVTFNQFGKEFPHGGMNEKGLVVELMWLDETQYPAEDSRAALSELQWIQYQLDNFSTVDEVIASNKDVRISNRNAVPLHYLVADAKGQVATIEFINGKLVAHKGSDLPYPVLTNTPYAKALEAVSAKGIEGAFHDNSVSRFATACQMVQQFKQTKSKEDPVDYTFQVLDKVAQGDYTKWRIAYDLTNRIIHFSTIGERKQVDLGGFDFSCRKEPVYLSLQSPGKGNVTNAFTTLTKEENHRLMQQSALESKSQVNVSSESIGRGAGYFMQVRCKNKD